MYVNLFPDQSAWRAIRCVSAVCAAALAVGCAQPESGEVERDAQATDMPRTTDNAVRGDDISLENEGSSNSDVVRSAESHVHGGATLALALDGNQLIVELDSPLYNLLGFEHAPETEAQRRAVQDAESKLSNADGMLGFNPEAGCEPALMSEDVHLFDGVEDHDDDHDDHNNHDNEHEDEHAEDDDHAAHRDFLLTYEFSCTSPSELDRVTVGLLDAFPLMTDLELVYLGPDTQTRYALNPSNVTIDLGR